MTNKDLFTDAEKARIYDYMYVKVAENIELYNSKIGKTGWKKDRLEMSVLVLNWVKSMMEDYYTAQELS